MSALTISTNSSYISALLAQQQVQADQAQVQDIQSKLAQAQSELDKDSAQAAIELQHSQAVQKNQSFQAQQAGLGKLAKNAQVAQQPIKSTVNTSGQTVGSVIHVVA
jgi:hypothetical protein